MAIYNRRFQGTEYQIGQVDHASLATPVRILYLKVDYTLQNGVAKYLDYANGSATYFVYNGVDAFVDDRQSGSALPPVHVPMPNYPEPPVIDCPTWVVFGLNINGPLSFRVFPNAVTTNDGSTGQMSSPDYFNLVHVLSDGTRYSNPSQQPPPQLPCHFVHFQTTCNGQMPSCTDDFNLYINGLQEPIDPEIKNTGHPPRVLSTPP